MKKLLPLKYYLLTSIIFLTVFSATAQPTWQVQSNYFGERDAIAQPRTTRGLALSQDGLSVYTGLIQSPNTGSTSLRKVSSQVLATAGTDYVIFGNGMPGGTGTFGQVGGQPVYAGGSSGTFQGWIDVGNSPEGIATDDRGNVYVALSSGVGNANRIDIFNSALTSQLGTFGSGSPTGIAIYKTGGNYFAYTLSTNGLQRWNVNNVNAPVLDPSYTPGIFNGINLCIDKDGTVFVAGNSQVRRISPAGVLTHTVPLASAQGVAVFYNKLYVIKTGSPTKPITVLNKADLTSGGADLVVPDFGITRSSTLSQFRCIDVNAQGRLYISEENYNGTQNTTCSGGGCVTSYVPPVTTFNPSPGTITGRIYFDRVVLSSPVEPNYANTQVTSTTPVSCFGGNNGTANVSFTEGFPSYSYSVDGGSYTTVAGSPFTITGLAGGPHTVTVKDGGGNTSTANFSISQPAAALAVSPSNNGPIGHGNTLNLFSNATGGTGMITFAWTGPNSFSDASANPSIPNAQSNASGTYNLLATDANGCQAPGSTDAAVYGQDLYVNDNSTAGDVFTGAVGNDANPGTAALPFATITKAISVAQDGDMIWVDAGTYNENVNVSKRLTIEGAGNGAGGSIVTSAAANVSTVRISANGNDASNVLKLKNIRVTGGNGAIGSNSSSGIEITGASGVAQFITFENIKSDNNQGNGICLNFSGSANNLKLLNSDLLNNGGSGFRSPSSLTLFDGLDIQSGHISSNGTIGLSFNPGQSNSSEATNINLNGTIFSGNGTSSFAGSGLGLGDISFSCVNGNFSLTNVVVNGLASNGSHIGIQFRGHNTIASSGTITLNNVTVTGSYRRPSLAASNPGGPGDGILIQNYSNVNNISFNNVSVNTTDGHALELAGLTTELNIGNTDLNAQNANAGDIVLGTSSQNPAATTNADATSAKFNGVAASSATLAQLFAIEDKIVHKIDVTVAGIGFVKVRTNNDYVTPNSFIPPTSTAANIQRGVDAAANGWTVNVAAGTFNNNVVVNKQVIVSGANFGVSCSGARGSESIVNGTSGSGTGTFNVQSDNVTIDGFTIKNHNGSFGITESGRSNLDFEHNIITDVGNNVSGSASSWGVDIEAGTTNNSSGINVSNNCINNIRGGANTSLTGSAAKSNNGSGGGILVGSSSDPKVVSSVTLNSNIISSITASTNDFANGGKGAYGMQLNVRGGSGNVNAPLIHNNEISNLEGLWAHGVGLEGRTPNAVVTNNLIHDLTDHKGPSDPDAAAIRTEDNDASGSIAVNYNSFTNVTLGISNVTASTVNGTCNWYGTISSSAIAAKNAGPVNYTPWLTDGTDTDPATGFQPSNSCNGIPVSNVMVSSKTDVTCFGGNNGSATITFQNGTSPYSYSLNAGPDVSVAGSPFTINSLTANSYTVVVKDGFGSTSSTNFTIMQPAGPLTLGPCSKTDATCNGSSTGSVSAGAITNSVGTVNYVWKNSSNVTVGTTANVSSLPADTYTLTVTDNCSSQSCMVTVGQPNALTLGPCSKTDATCNGTSTGSVSAGTVTNSVGTVNYVWKNSSNVTVGTTANVGSLPANTYTLTITDNCSSQSCMVTVGQPNALTLGPCSKTDATCNGSNTGTVTAGSVTNAVGMVSYTWTNSSNGVIAHTVSVTDLPAGTYNLTVSDNCFNRTCSVTVGEPGPLTLGTCSKTDATCNGTSTGSVSAGTVTNSVGTVSYTWKNSSNVTVGTTPTVNNLPAGMYNLTVTDNCSSKTCSVTVGQPGVLTLGPCSKTDASCNSGSDGSVSAGAVSNSVGTVNYVWKNSANATVGTTPTVNNLPADTYTLTVTDNCSSRNCTVTVGQPGVAYTVLGLKDVKLGETNIVYGAVGNTASGQKVSINKNSTVNGFVRASVITLTQPVTITGGTINSPAVATLPTMQLNTAVVPAGNFTVPDNGTATINTNYTNLTIGKSANVTVNGTIYGKIVVKEGAQVTFTAGTININDLQTEPGKANVNYTTLNFTGTSARIKNTIQIGDRNRINAPALTFYMGDNNTDAEKFTVNGNDTKLTANVYMPMGTLAVKGANGLCVLTGTFIAQNISSDNMTTWVGNSCNNPIPLARAMFAEESPESEPAAKEPFAVKVMPNPSTTDFRIQLTGGTDEQIQIRITNETGQLQSAKLYTAKGSFVTLGSDLKTGIYFAEVIQGNNRQVVKLIKLK